MRGRDKKNQRKQSDRQPQQAAQTQKDQSPLAKFLALVAELGASVEQSKTDERQR